MDSQRIGACIALMSAALILLLGAPGDSAGADTILVPSGSAWRYMDNGSYQAAEWRAVAFDDGTWDEGPAQLGYGDGDEATVISYGPDPDNKYVTTYFRHSVDVLDPSQYACVLLRLLRDDGAIVYLNGEEVCRCNMPAGAINHLTLASSGVSGNGEAAFLDYYLHPSCLSAGTNVLAVEVHQVNGTSSDASFDLELSASTSLPPLMRKGPYLIYPGDNTRMEVHWQLVWTDTCALQWGTDTTYSMGTVETTEYGSDHQHAYTLEGLAPGVEYYYRVVAGSTLGTGCFYSAPPEDAIAVKLFAYGDTRSYPADHDKVAGAMVSAYQDDQALHSFVLSVGDLVSDGDDEADWDTEFFDASYADLHEMLATLPYQSAMGNHEGSGVLFTKYFPYPFVGGRYWSFDYGPAHVAVVDQYTSYSPGSAQLTWLAEDLATTTKPWKFICLHEPGWSAGHHANNTAVQTRIQPLCEAYGVLVVFAGHNHYYARAVVNGVHHITTGGGGAPLYDPDPGYPNVVAAARAYHYCKAEITGGVLTIKALAWTGALLDSFTVSLPGAGIESPAEDGADDDRQGGVILKPIHPNPIREQGTVSFEIGTDMDVRVDVFDIRGRKVRNLVDRSFSRGAHSVTWDGRDASGRAVPSGIYIYSVKAGVSTRVCKVVVAG